MMILPFDAIFSIEIAEQVIKVHKYQENTERFLDEFRILLSKIPQSGFRLSLRNEFNTHCEWHISYQAGEHYTQHTIDKYMFDGNELKVNTILNLMIDMKRRVDLPYVQDA